MSDVLTISAKDLGWLAMPTFCDRCFWIRRHMTLKPPFQTFPGIFQHIDGYTKRVVHGIFDRDGAPPAWLKELGVCKYIEPPTYKTLAVHFDNNVVLRGSPDGVFVKSDESLVVIDYKTAAFLGVDDPLHPIYDVQLNTYAMLLQHLGYGTVSGLALIYCQPLTGNEPAQAEHNARPDGFAMSYNVVILPVELSSEKVISCVVRAREIYDRTECPKQGREGCKDCLSMDDMMRTLKSVQNPYLQIGCTAQR